MKTKSLKEIKKQLLTTKDNDYPNSYVTGDEFEQWLKDKKKDIENKK